MVQNKTMELDHSSPEEFFLRPLVVIVDPDSQRGLALRHFFEAQGIQAEIRPRLSLRSLLRQPENILPIVIWNVSSQENFPLKAIREWKRRPRIFSLILLSDPDPTGSDLIALRHGWVDQVASPDHWSALLSAVRSEIEKHNYRQRLLQATQQLQKLTRAKDRSLRRAEELEEIYNATLENLMTALDLRDVETFGHSRVVARYSQALAQILGIKDRTVLDHIRQGALLHDVGKIAIPDSILKKPGHLTAEEWEKVKLHPVLGYGLIKEIKLVAEVGHIILYHHERYDGRGYPHGLEKEAIPLEARIFALADALDAITSHRPYRKERDFQAAREEILTARGQQFDPKIVEAFCSLQLEDWEKIRYETTKIFPALENFKSVNTKS